ncbi:phenylalanine--tRNA ligase subunit beta [Dermacoccaceae bacterium W4C1]
MLVPIEWLGEYVALPADITGAQVAADLVRVGLEEEGISGGEITGPLVVGRVLSLEPEKQKNGKTINWCSLDVGSANGTGQPQGIVCGAHNFGVGDLVVVVLPGAVLPGGFEISARKTYGHLSAGMICAADELGLPDDGSDGIIRLAELLPQADLEPGQDAVPLLGLDRETIEVNVTPDRGYCFSLRGIAREFAASTGAQFTDPALAALQRVPTGLSAGHPVEVADEAPVRGQQGCSRYVARVVRGVHADQPSPTWMQTRLTEAGMRPISIAVDITNYVMLALGQPLHAFDLDTLNGPIVVRRAVGGEKFTTLDETERTLDAQDLVVTDGGDRVLALAGVMGGADSEVGPATRDILIEAAHFSAISVARTSRRHRLVTEASKRFERGVDPQIAAAAAQLAVELLVSLAGGTADEAGTDLNRVEQPAPITFDPGLPTRLVGVDYQRSDVVRILGEIGCAVAESGTGEGDLSVTPPSWRPDLRNGPDLVEEVARIDGYDRIPSVLPTPPGGRGLTRGQQVRRLLATLLAARGLNEVLSPPFVGPQIFDAFGYDAQDPRRAAVRIANPLSEEQPLLRTSLLASLSEVARRNVTRGTADFALFEIGLVTTGTPGLAPTFDTGVNPSPQELQQILDAVPDQPRHLAYVLVGQHERSGWWGSGRPADWSDAVAIARAVADAVQVPVTVRGQARAPFHPGRCAVVETADGVEVGVVGELHPKVISALGLPERTVAGELDLDVLIAAGEPAQASTLVHQPAAHSDVALVVDESVTAAAVAQALRTGAGELLEGLTLFDTWSGEQLGAGKRSLAFRMTYRAPDRTLTTEEVNGLRDAAIAAAAREHGAQQRG